MSQPEVRRRRLGGGIGLIEKTEEETPVVVTIPEPTATLSQKQHNLPPELLELARKAYTENRAAAAATKAADKSKADLTAMLIRGEYGSVEIQVTLDGKTKTVDVGMEARETEKIDVTLLQGIVSNEDFLKIVTASKAAVEKVGGKNAVVRSSKMTKGDASLKFAERK